MPSKIKRDVIVAGLLSLTFLLLIVAYVRNRRVLAAQANVQLITTQIGIPIIPKSDAEAISTSTLLTKIDSQDNLLALYQRRVNTAMMDGFEMGIQTSIDTIHQIRIKEDSLPDKLHLPRKEFEDLTLEVLTHLKTSVRDDPKVQAELNGIVAK